MSRAKRRDRIEKNGGTHTLEEWFELCRFFNRKCLACGTKRKLTKDHVVPVVKGGSNDIFNLQPLCPTCNVKKGDSIVDYRDPGILDTFRNFLDSSSSTLSVA